MQLSLIPHILVCICLIAMVNQYLWFKVKQRNVFQRLIGTVNAYLGLHGFYVLIIELFFHDRPYLDYHAPFAFMYGPFLYFAITILRYRRIPLRQVILHSFPAILLWILFVILVVLGQLNNTLLYKNLIRNLSPLSFSGYTVWAIINNAKALRNQMKEYKLVILAAIILLLFVSVIMTTGIFNRSDFYTKVNAKGLIRGILYVCMLGGTFLIFRFYIHLMLSTETVAEPVFESRGELENAVFAPEAKYEKSALTAAQLEIYAEKLEILMEEKQIYLQHDLSLVKLAQLLRIPSHHVTQLFSVKMRLNFYDYINGYRVDHACILLKQDHTATIETIATLSGYNSKVSFNRHFRAIVGCTPSQYRQDSQS